MAFFHPHPVSGYFEGQALLGTRLYWRSMPAPTNEMEKWSLEGKYSSIVAVNDDVRIPQGRCGVIPNKTTPGILGAKPDAMECRSHLWPCCPTAPGPWPMPWWFHGRERLTNKLGSDAKAGCTDSFSDWTSPETRNRARGGVVNGSEGPFFWETPKTLLVLLL